MARTANIGRLSVSLEANTAKYTQKLKNAKKDTDKHSKDIGKSFNTMGKSAKLGIAAIGVAAVAATIEAKKLAESYVAVEKQMRSLAEAAGLTSKELKAQAYALSEAGLSAEQIGQIYLDTTDRIGEFATAGSGAFQDFVDVMKMTKGDAQALARELQYLSGDEVLQFMANEMQKANVSASKMTFVLESMGSDASKAAKLLTENADAVKNLRNEYLTLSREADSLSIKAFEEAQKQTELFFSNLGAIATDALAPAMEAYTKIIKNINKILPESAESRNKAFGLNAREELETQYKALSVTERTAKVKEGLEKKLVELTKHRAEIESKSAEQQKKVDEAKIKRDEKAAKTFQDYTKPKSNDFTYGAADQAKKAQPLIDQNALNNTKKELDDYNAKIKAIQTEIKDLGEISTEIAETTTSDIAQGAKELNKLFSEGMASTPEAIGKQWALAEQEFKDTYDALYKGSEEYNDALARLNKSYSDKYLASLQAIEDKEQELLDKKLEEQAKFLFAKNQLLAKAAQDEVAVVEEQRRKELDAAKLYYNNDSELYEAYVAAKAEINEKYDQQVAIAKNKSENENLIDMAESLGHTQMMFNDLGGIISAFGGETSGAAQAMFAVAKGAAVAQAVMNGYVAASEAWADPHLPFMAKAAAAVGAVANVAGLVASIKSTQIQGQAHSGLDEVPSSHDNSTFLLKAGERVVQPEANKDLTAYLNSQKSNATNGNGGSITVSAPVTIQGNVTDQKWFNAELVKHRDTIAAAVEKVKKERPMTARRGR